MRHLKDSGVRLGDLDAAEPVAVRELRITKGKWLLIRLSYLLFRTAYGYHAIPGDWTHLTVVERAWLRRHEVLVHRALLADVEAVDAEGRHSGADFRIGARGNATGNGHLPAGRAGVPTGDSVGPGGGGMGGTDEADREAVPGESTAGGGRELPEAPGDVPEGAPVPEVLTPAPLYEEVIPGIPCDLTMTTLTAALDKVGVIWPVPTLHVHLDGVNTAIEVVMALRVPVLIEVDPRIRDWDTWFVEWQGRRVGSVGA